MSTRVAELQAQAQVALSSLKAIIHEYIRLHPGATSTDVVNAFGIHTDYEGQQKNYFSWSVIGLLVNEGNIRYEQASGAI